jgi:hypothetical protein
MNQFRLNKQKCHFFSFTKLENKKIEQILPEGLIPVGGRRWGKGVAGCI